MFRNAPQTDAALSRACLLALYAILLIGLGGLSRGQDTQPVETRPAVDTRPAAETQPADFVYKIPEEGIPLEILAHDAEVATGLAFILPSDKNPLKGKTIRLFGEARVPRDQVMSLFQALFVTQGYALKPLGDESGRILVVDSIDTAGDLKQHAIFVGQDELDRYRNEVGTVVMTLFPLKHVKLQNVRSAISQLLTSKSVELVLDVESANSLIVFGFAPTVFAIKQVIGSMDVARPEEDLRFEMINLEVAVAEEVEPIIRNLIESNATARGGAPQGGQAGGVISEKPAPKLVVDPRLNAIAVYAVDADILEIRRLVGILDQEVGQPAENLHIIKLFHVDADDLAEVLKESLGSGGGRGSRGGSRGGGGGRLGGASNGRGAGRGGAVASSASASDDVLIVADKHTNSLVIRAHGQRYEGVRNLIAQLDKRRPQVIIQGVVAELTETQLKQIGTEIAAFGGGSGAWHGAALTGFGLSTINFTPATATAPPSLVRLPVFPGDPVTNRGGIFGLFNDSLNVPLFVSLLEGKGRGNLLSAPLVVANDNQTSLIETIKSIPGTSFTSGSGTVTGATGGLPASVANSGADTTEFGGYQEAKISLKVSPHISNDDYVRLDVDLLVERFDETTGQTIEGTETQPSTQPTTRPSSPSSIPPDKTSRRLVGSVTLKNGATVVIGGLVLDNQSKLREQVPGFGDAPLLEPLFGVTQRQKERATIYFFLTPTIISAFDQLDSVSYEKKLEIRKLQGPVKLIDPDFRPILLDDRWIGIDGIEASGYLDMPRYAAIVPLQECGPGEKPVQPAQPVQDAPERPR